MHLGQLLPSRSLANFRRVARIDANDELRKSKVGKKRCPDKRKLQQFCVTEPARRAKHQWACPVFSLDRAARSQSSTVRRSRRRRSIAWSIFMDSTSYASTPGLFF